MRKVFTIVLLVVVLFGKAQTPTWSADIASIFYTNCTKCHHDGGLAPFSMMNYQTVYTKRFNISTAVSNRIMPPWPPDAHYTRFANERLLSYNDVIKINAWVSGGAPMGDSATAPTPPVYTNGSELGTPDISVRIPDFTVPANQTADIYQCFVVPAGNLQAAFITALEVIPGNASIVHHVLVYQDTTGQAAALDANTPEPGYTQFGGVGVNGAGLIAGWVPGSRPSFMPANMGIRLKPNADLIIQIHYPMGSANKLDSTRINLRLSSAALRPITLTPILNHFTSLQNGPLTIPANSTKLFNAYAQMPNADVTLISVAPHAHLIARSWESYGVTQAGDTIPFIKINDWDFHWQGSYGFRNLVKLPKRTKLYANAFYDNTANNPHNPSSPPQAVSQGESTTEEMMLIYFAYTPYQAGDENIVIDSSALIDVSDAGPTGVTDFDVDVVVSTPQFYEPVPNPSSTETQFKYFLPQQSNNVVIKIFDLAGKLVAEFNAAGNVGFNSVTYSTSNLPNGNYLSTLNTSDFSSAKKLIVTH